MYRLVLFLIYFFVFCRDVIFSQQGDTDEREFPENGTTEKFFNDGDHIGDVVPETVLVDTPASWSNSEGSDSESENGTGSVDKEKQAETEDRSMLPQAERAGGRRLGASRYKSGRPQVEISDLTPEDLPRHGAIVHQAGKPALSKPAAGHRDNSGEESSSEMDDHEHGVHRKRRIPSSSAPPSVQIAILVIGAVLGCVLLTGFIRWRVRARIEARKSKKLADDFLIYRGRMSYSGDIPMDTIYECECEEGQNAPHTHDKPGLDPIVDEDGPSFDEIYCSHRFDRPLMSHSSNSAGHHARLIQPDSPKCGRDLGLIWAPKRRGVNKHTAKTRYYKHQKKRLENMFVQKLETIPMENSTPAFEDGEHPSSATPLLHQVGSAHFMRASSERLATSDTPILLRRSSPPPSRGILGSILNTWRSLSFDREWVGKMWQEQHNIRRISDLLRRLTSSSSEGERSRPDTPTTDTDSNPDQEMRSSNSRLSVIGDGSFTTPGPVTIESADIGSHVITMSNDQATDNTELPDRLSSAAASHSLDPRIAGQQKATPVSDPSSDPQSPVPQRSPSSQNGHNFWPFSGHQTERLDFDSFLDTGDHLSRCLSGSMTEHPRYQKIHRRRRSEDRGRTVRHVLGPHLAGLEKSDRSPLSRIHRAHGQAAPGSSCEQQEQERLPRGGTKVTYPPPAPLLSYNDTPPPEYQQ